jgi:hypothetical protein
VWGGFKPLGAKSIRAKDIPSVFSPNNWSTVTGVTVEPNGFDVFAGSICLKKSSALTRAGSLQNFPFTNTANYKAIVVIIKVNKNL